MSTFVDRIKELYHTVLQHLPSWLHGSARPKPAPPVTPPAEPPEELSAAAQPPQPPLLNRTTRRALDRERRKYERARMKFDKFVTPKGEAPVKIERGELDQKSKPQPEPAPAPTLVDPNDRLLVDELIEGDGTQVLFAESELFEFNFRDSILDQLDRYWIYLDRMKKHDAEAYGFYKLLGAVLVPRLATGHREAPPEDKKMTAQQIAKYRSEIVLPSWFKRQRPGFGCLACGTDPLTERREKEISNHAQFPRFIYYTKYSQPPPEIQMVSGGDVYKVTVWWDNLKRGNGYPTEFAVFVSRDGNTIQVLRTLKTRKHRIKRKNKFEWFSIPQRDWRIPESFEHWANEFGLDASTHLAHLFTNMVQHLEITDYSMIRVQVHKNDLTAVFGVNVERLAYFFRDRDIELTEGGLKRRIFHLVRPHVRSDGVAVKMHFRGSSEFEWAGYRVKITVPGRDHFVLSQVDIGCSDEYWMDDKKKFITEPQYAKKLHDRMEAGIKHPWPSDK